MLQHFLFDLLAYAIGTLLVLKVFKSRTQLIADENLRYIYYTVIIVGAFFGAFIIGSLNTYLSIKTENSIIIGKSILGAIIGATIAVESFKKIMKIKGSTGAYFVPSLVIGIAIGRIGCFLSGLEDYTYGVETNFILGYDFGDGVLRHPVQLYESATMLLFFGYLLWIYGRDRDYFEKNIFYQFILVYAIQRFIWEFLKPYESIALGLNIFQFLCLGLVVYQSIIHRTQNLLINPKIFS
jgi:prolipoprotein diacylglyceryltransferase